MKQLSLLTVCACALSAQTLQISPNPLTMTAQANTGASTTLTLTSSGAAIQAVVSVNPGASWLHVSPATQVTTPVSITVSTDPLVAGSYSGSLTVASTVGQFSIPVTLNVSVIGVNPTALNFPYVLGGSIPSAQNVSVAVPAGITAMVSRSTNNGGSWLNIAVTGGSTPTAIAATIDPGVAPTLAPGAYTGTITVTPTSGSNLTPATVQVTLTVTTAPTVTVTPASLSFNYQIGGTNNLTQQTIQLSGSSQAVQFAFTSDSWISVSPPSGTVPANGSVPVTVTVVPPSQTPNTYTGAITLTTFSSQKIPVTIVVSNNPLLNVPGTPLSFSYSIGGAIPAAATVTPTSTGTALQYTVAANQPWLVVPTGVLTTPNPVSINVNPINLAPGNYSGIVTFTNTAAGSVGQQVPVTLQVTNNPVLGVFPGALTFLYQVGQPQQPAAQIVSVFSTTEVPLSYTATTSTSWLGLVGHTSGTTDDSFTVSVNPAGVPVGSNLGTVNIAVANAATGASLGNVTVPVTFYVSNNPLLVVNPAQPIYLILNPGSQTARQDISLTSTGTDVALSVSQPQTDSGGQWLFVSSANTGTPSTLSLIASLPAGGLAPGSYTGSVTVTATGAATVLDSPYKVPVVLVVTSGSISASVPSLSFRQTASGAPPAAQTFNVISSPAGLNFFVTSYDGGLGWLSASAGTGVAPGSVTVSVDGSRLSPGTYQGRVIVSSNVASGSPIVVLVNLQVVSGTISAPTTPLVFTAAAGSTTALTQNVTVSGAPGPLAFSVSASTSVGSWLTVTQSSATTPATVQVTANPSGLGINTYTGSVTITSPGASGSPITIPVTLNIVTPQTVTVTPALLQFDYTIGQTVVPASQTVQVQSSGGAVPFTAAASSTGNWLQVSPPSGTTNATLTVSVNPQGLAAATYSGTVTVTSANSLVAAVVQVTLTVTQTPKPVVSSVKNAASYFVGALAPGEMVSLIGVGIGPATGAIGPQVSGATMATTLAGTRVLFDNVAAPIIFTRTDQTTVVVPYDVAGRPTTTVRVEFNGVQSDPIVYNVIDVAPGIFTLNQQGTGPGAIRNSADFSVNSPNAPAARGGYVSVYMTGEGATAPPGANGFVAPADGSLNKKPLAQVTATVGGVPAFVQYAGSAPGTVNGFTQVNVQIPANAPSGVAVPIVITFSSATTTVSTQPGVTVVVQ